MTCILELNDAALTLYRDHTVVHRSPGVAVVLDDDVRFGEEALRVSRIHPRQANQQYFTRLNADPLPAPGRRARNHADLVYLHLMTFKPLIDAEGGEVLLAVPGILSPDQLGVLLGVIQEVGIRVVGFVDAAVAALSTRQMPPQVYHVDVMLQRAVVTAVDAGGNAGDVGGNAGDVGGNAGDVGGNAGGSVSKSGAQEVQECGLNRLLDAWINVIADRFVRETRFDPLHAAATEQQLFNQVYDWIESGADSAELVVEISHSEHTRRVELSRGVLEDKAEQRLRQLADVLPRGSHVFLSARSARLPGLYRTLEDLQIQAVALAEDALPKGCLGNLGHIVPEDGELRLVTRLPHAAGTLEAAPTAVSAGPAPTHALRGHEAWPLERSGLPVHREAGEPFLRAEHGVRLNDVVLQNASHLNIGDRVLLGEHEYLIIHVKD